LRLRARGRDERQRCGGAERLPLPQSISDIHKLFLIESMKLEPRGQRTSMEVMYFELCGPREPLEPGGEASSEIHL
jgi:hypothetical protein